MRKSQFSEEQILGILKRVDGGQKVARSAVSRESARARITAGKRSMADSKSASCDGCANSKTRIASSSRSWLI